MYHVLISPFKFLVMTEHGNWDGYMKGSENQELFHENTYGNLRNSGQIPVSKPN